MTIVKNISWHNTRMFREYIGHKVIYERTNFLLNNSHSILTCFWQWLVSLRKRRSQSKEIYKDVEWSRTRQNTYNAELIIKALYFVSVVGYIIELYLKTQKKQANEISTTSSGTKWCHIDMSAQETKTKKRMRHFHERIL